MTAWRFDNARFSFSPTTFSLSGAYGQIVALVGPNGAGKTSLLRALLGDPVLRDGAAYLEGDTLPASRLPATAFPGRVGYLPQDAPLPLDVTCGALVRMGWIGRLSAWEAPSDSEQRRFESLVTALGLSEKLERPLSKLSMGERQRAALARVLLPEPKVLLLDEPTNHLDPPAATFLWKFLRERVANDRNAVVISTHDVASARRHAHRLVGIRQGAPVTDGATFDAKAFERTYGVEEV